MKILFLILGTLAALLAVTYLFANREVIVRVENVGNTTLRSVRVHVTGNRYSLGNIEPGEYRRIAVAPSGESRIEIEQRQGSRAIVNCQFEPGHKGNVSVALDGQRISQQGCEITSFF